MNGLLTRLLGLLLLGITLSGCGFHMRGGDSIPSVREITLIGDERDDLYRSVAMRLQRVGVSIVPAKEGVPELKLGLMQTKIQVASVDSRAQNVEYIMLFNTEYTVTEAGHPTQRFTAAFNRSFLNKSSEALASSREQEQLRDEMREQTAELILIQLSRVKF